MFFQKGNKRGHHKFQCDVSDIPDTTIGQGMPWKAMSLSSCSRLKSSRSTSHEEQRRMLILGSRSRNEFSDYLSNTNSTETAKVRHPDWNKHIQLQHSGNSYMRHPYTGVPYKLSLCAVRQCLDVHLWQYKPEENIWTLKIWVLLSEFLF